MGNLPIQKLVYFHSDLPILKSKDRSIFTGDLLIQTLVYFHG
jgi:hypothetical protein